MVNGIPEKTVVKTDPDIISIVLRNLLHNAIKFSEQGKSVEVTFFENGKNNIKIKDQGIGMSSEAINQLFSHESNSTLGTSGEKGSGLGLALCLDFLKLINGSIQVKSEPGKGSEFLISI
jgi:signal transduction histidine kinase